MEKKNNLTIHKNFHSAMRKSSAGFTLLETILYIGFTVFLLASVIAISYPLFTNAERLSVRTTGDIEISFALQKMTWMLSSMETINLPVSGGNGTTLSVTSVGGATTMLREDGDMFSFSNDAGTTWMPLTASRAVISNLAFIHIAPTGGAPRAIEVSFDANGVPQGPYTYYARF